ncbi:MAG: hypothetical protein H0X24_25700 [Ktedonobacterales bacterium]|nr:hypothetical protein [Ktedonobacterales bacterium]
MMVEEKTAAQERMTEQPTVRVAVAPPQGEVTGKQRRAMTLPGKNVVLFNRVRVGGIITIALIQTGLLLTAYLPARIITDLGWTISNGPFPAATAPVVTLLFYLLPFGSGLLAQRWDLALLASTAPAWLAIGLFMAATSTQNGIFYFTKLGQPANLVGTLELFAALGFFGWITRRVFSRHP